MTCPAVVAHCDWSTDPRKRWMAVAIRHPEGWRLAQPEPVGDTADLFTRLARRSHGGVLVGFDFPIGLPAAYGKRTGFSGFTEAFSVFGYGDWRDWYSVCEDQHEISLHRPFYPMRPGGRRRTDLLTGLGLSAEELLRQCDRGANRPAACMLFWTLGGNQVGKGAITGWRDLLAPNLERLGLWPFAGSLEHLLGKHELVVAETYPGEVYGQLSIPRRPVWSKRRPEGRQRAAQHLLRWLDARPVIVDQPLRDYMAAGFSTGSVGEDQFDAMVGLLGMLDVVERRRDAGAPATEEVTTWEGWILGQKYNG